MFPQPRANTPREFEAQERDADLLASTLLPLAGFRLTAGSAVLQSTVPEVVKELHLANVPQAQSARIAQAHQTARAICQLLAQKRHAMPTAAHLKPAYGAAPLEAEAWKSLQASVDAEHSCAGVE